MSERRWVEVEDMEVFQKLEALSDAVWDEVQRWNFLAQETVGKQLVRAVDSIGANLVEGDGRYTYKDTLHFFYVARASGREARWWLKRAQHRRLL